MTTLAHIVLYVKDLQDSISFYVEIVGLGMRGETFNGRAAVLSGGSIHHELRDMEYPIHEQADQTISQSLYLFDPDGNEVELYVDNPDYDWSNNDNWIQVPVKTLELD